MSVSVRIRCADRDVAVDLAVADGETVAVMGPNGSGKSTLLESIAGLVRPDSGEIRVGERGVTDLPAHRRAVGLLAQEPLLFPHLSVLDNVAFGPRSAGASRGESREIARRWLTEVDALEFAARRPRELSGGQAQRIALARTLAADPQVVALDEPLAFLDTSVAASMRQLLKRVLVGRTALLVTHDVLDALMLADRVVVLESGRVVEDGPTAQVLSRPRSAFAARVAGLNLVRGVWDGRQVGGIEGVVDGGADGGVDGGADGVEPGAEAVAVFRPSAVAVYREHPTGSPRNVIAATVTEIEPLDERFRLRTDRFSADLTAGAVADLGLAPGEQVHLVVKASEVAVYPG